MINDQWDAKAVKQPRKKIRQLIIPIVLLSIPFLVPVVLLDGLSQALPTFHDTDEYDYHYPIILKFIETFPKMELQDYQSATTPLLYIVFAAIGKIFGTNIVVFRLSNAVISYFAAIAFFLYFYFSLNLDRMMAFLLGLTLSLSHYFYGASFCVLTDNIATLFFVVSLIFAFEFNKRNSLEYLVWSALFASCAILTRQLYGWLILFLGANILVSKARMFTKVSSLAVLGLAVAPFLVLCVIWGGANPPAFQIHFGLNGKVFGFLLACIGAYGVLIVLPGLLQERYWAKVISGPKIVAALGLSFILLLLFPLRYSWTEDSTFVTDGLLWKVSKFLPEVLGSGALFFLLVPFSLLLILDIWQKDGWRSPILWIFAGFSAMSITNAVLYQKYYDLIALMIVLMIAIRHGLPSQRHFPIVLSLVCLCFILYVMYYYAGLPAYINNLNSWNVLQGCSVLPSTTLAV